MAHEQHQSRLSDEQLEQLSKRTGLRRRELEIFLRRLESPDITQQEQLAMLSQLTGRDQSDISQSVSAMRLRHLESRVRPLLGPLLGKLRLLRTTGSIVSSSSSPSRANYSHEYAIPLDQALRLVALLEQVDEPDGYVYHASITPTRNRGCHRITVSWRHTQRQLQSDTPLFCNELEVVSSSWCHNFGEDFASHNSDLHYPMSRSHQ